METEKFRALLYMRAGNNPSDNSIDYKETQIAMQQEKLNKICELNGFDPVAKIIYQGKAELTESGMMEKIKSEIIKNDIDVLVAASVSRLTRNAEEMYELYNWLSKNNKMINVLDVDMENLKMFGEMSRFFKNTEDNLQINGTPCLIAKQIGEDKYLSIHCKIEGHLGSTGKLLANYFNTPEQVDKLLAHGNIYSVASKLDTEHLKFKENGEPASIKSIEDIMEGETDIEYLYVFTQDNRWKYINLNTDEMELRDVADVLKANDEQVYDIHDPYAWLKADLNKFLVSTEPNEVPKQSDISMT